MTLDLIGPWLAYRATWRPCTKCGVTQPPEAYYYEPSRRGRGGRRYDCRGCVNARTRAYYRHRGQTCH